MNIQNFVLAAVMAACFLSAWGVDVEEVTDHGLYAKSTPCNTPRNRGKVITIGAGVGHPRQLDCRKWEEELKKCEAAKDLDDLCPNGVVAIGGGAMACITGRNSRGGIEHGPELSLKNLQQCSNAEASCPYGTEKIGLSKTGAALCRGKDVEKKEQPKEGDKPKTDKPESDKKQDKQDKKPKDEKKAEDEKKADEQQRPFSETMRKMNDTLSKLNKTLESLGSSLGSGNGSAAGNSGNGKSDGSGKSDGNGQAGGNGEGKNQTGDNGQGSGDDADVGLNMNNGDIPERKTFDFGTFSVKGYFTSNGTCPAPLTVDLGVFGKMELSYGWICKVAKLMRGVVIAFAWFGAILIIVKGTKEA